MCHFRNYTVGIHSSKTNVVRFLEFGDLIQWTRVKLDRTVCKIATNVRVDFFIQSPFIKLNGHTFAFTLLNELFYWLIIKTTVIGRA